MIRAVFAVGTNGEFGLAEGGMPWPHNPEDMKHFARVTKGFDLIMGHSTYKTLPFPPTKDRRFVVITRTPRMDKENIYFRSMENVRHVLATSDEVNAAIIGGTSLLTQDLLDLCDEIYITRIEKPFPADIHLQIPELSNFKKVIISTDPRIEKYAKLS